MTTPDWRVYLANSIEEAMGHLSQALVELDRVPAYDKATIGSVAHAMDNYLSVTEATLDLIGQAVRENRNLSEVVTWLEGLRQLANLMYHTVGRLIRVSTPSEFPLKPEYMNLTTMMDRAVSYYRTNAGEKHLKIESSFIGDVPLGLGRSRRRGRRGRQSVVEALKFSNPGIIRVEITAGPGGVTCSVFDNGPGLTPAEQARLFTAKGKNDPPRGYGLTMAKEFIDRMGGRLWSQSEPGKGACFSFRLPYHPEGLFDPPVHGRQMQRAAPETNEKPS